MNREERQKIYFLLSQFYENAKQLKSPAKLTAWGLVLENYTYDDVKARILEYAARNKFFPDISDITAGLTAVSEPLEEHPFSALESFYWSKWEGQIEQLKQQEAASGGPCQLRKLRDADRDAGENMMRGLFLRRHYPEACGGCRRLQLGRTCQEEVITRHIDREREACLIMQAHKGDGTQSEVLKRYWRDLCPLCAVVDCFWPKGMNMIEEDS